MPGMRSIGTSIPRSPRAIMIPYEASMISSMLSTPSWFSILDIIFISLLCSSRIFCTASTSSLLRTKECAMKSMSSSIASSMFALSFSVRAGRSMCSPGTLTLFFEPSIPSFCTSTTRESPSFPITFMSSSPSSKSTSSPTCTSFTKLGYETLMQSCDVSSVLCPKIFTLSPVL